MTQEMIGPGRGENGAGPESNLQGANFNPNGTRTAGTQQVAEHLGGSATAPPKQERGSAPDPQSAAGDRDKAARAPSLLAIDGSGDPFVPLTEAVDHSSPNYGQLDLGGFEVDLSCHPEWLVKLIVNGESNPSRDPKDTLTEIVRALAADKGLPDDIIEVLLTDCPELGIHKTAASIRDGAQVVRNLIASHRGEGSTEHGHVLIRKRWHRSADMFVNRFAPTLRHYQQDYFRYRNGAYHVVDDSTVEAAARRFLIGARISKKVDGTWIYEPFDPSNKDISELMSAVRHMRHVERSDDAVPPLWLPGHQGEAPDPKECISLRNGILHAPTRSLLPATADFFTHNALAFDFDTNAKCPLWEKTLSEYWQPNADGSPADEVLLLQEMFGYLLLPWTSLHKIFMLLGVTRSGKTTIARVLRMLIGDANVCAPTLGSLGGEFGLQNLIGKQLAIISELAFGPRHDRVTVTGYLKQISGEDPIDANRKNKGFWTGTLLIRFLLLANKTPSFADDSSALGARMVILRMTESFLGREDPDLVDKLEKELPGILNWALAGYDRLRMNKKFTEPESSKASRAAFNRLSSSTRAFVEERCAVVDGPHDTDESIRAAFVRDVDLYAAYKDWCGASGVMPERRSEFIEGVTTAFPGKAKAHRVKKEIDAKRPWGILGIALTSGIEHANAPPF